MNANMKDIEDQDNQLKSARLKISIFKYQCNFCSYVSSKKKSIEKHQDSIHLGIKYECGICDKQFKWEKDVNIHKKSVHSKQRLICNNCDFETTNMSRLTKHIQLVHEGLKYLCPDCEKQFSSKKYLTAHIKSVHKSEGRNFICSLCGKHFSHASSLANHKSVHSTVILSCNICDFKAKRKGQLKEHKQTMHEGSKNKRKYNPGGPVNCSHCGKSYTDKKSLWRHKNTEHYKIRYYCSFCDFKGTNLRRHIRSIHEGKKHPCSICAYQATQTNSLKNHMKRIHKTSSEVCSNPEVMDNPEPDVIPTDEAKIVENDFIRELVEKSPEINVKEEAEGTFDENFSETLVEVPIKFSVEELAGIDVKPTFLTKDDDKKTTETIIKRECDIDDCDYQTSLTENLEAHQELIHKDFTLQCEDCPCQFTDNENFEEHTRSEHSADIWTQALDVGNMGRQDILKHVKRLSLSLNMEKSRTKTLRQSLAKHYIKSLTDRMSADTLIYVAEKVNIPVKQTQNRGIKRIGGRLRRKYQTNLDFRIIKIIFGLDIKQEEESNNEEQLEMTQEPKEEEENTQEILKSEEEEQTDYDKYTTIFFEESQNEEKLYFEEEFNDRSHYGENKIEAVDVCKMSRHELFNFAKRLDMNVRNNKLTTEKLRQTVAKSYIKSLTVKMSSDRLKSVARNAKVYSKQSQNRLAGTLRRKYQRTLDFRIIQFFFS